MTKLWSSLAGALVLSTAYALAAPAWRHYTNERFGATADVPSAWRADPLPNNGDGLRFVSSDGASSIVISGSFQTDGTVEQALSSRSEAGTGETITYRLRTPRMVVVSGTRGDQIVYRKSILGCRNKIWNDLSIQYSASRRAEFESIVTHTAASLHQGRGSETTICL